MMRSKRLMERLAARGISAALIHKRVNMRYLSGYTGEGCLLVTDEGMTVFTDFRYVEQVSRQAPESRCVRTRNGQELMPWCAKRWAGANRWPLRMISFRIRNIAISRITCRASRCIPWSAR